MSGRAPASRRVGLWSALIVVFLGAAYIAIGTTWLVSGGFRSPQPLRPAEPFLTLLRLSILLSAPALVALMSAVHTGAPPGEKVYSLTALAFTIVFAALTSGVHFVQLTAVRQGLSLPPSTDWPSVSLALDFLAWDGFLGLALLSAAPVFRGDKLRAAIRAGMALSGALCVAGAVGISLGYPRLHLLAVAGFGAGLPVVCVLLARLFARRDASISSSE